MKTEVCSESDITGGKRVFQRSKGGPSSGAIIDDGMIVSCSRWGQFIQCAPKGRTKSAPYWGHPQENRLEGPEPAI